MTAGTTPSSTCSIEGCTRPVAGRGWCRSHYNRWRRHGDPTVIVRRSRLDPPAVCSEEGCENPVRVNGICRKHYHRWRKANRPLSGTCCVEGCDKVVFNKSRGLCAMHYGRVRRRGDPLAVPKTGPNAPHPECLVEGCDRVCWARGFCTLHYQRWQTHGDPAVVAVPGRLPDDELTYHAAHVRVAVAYGAAADHTCVDCGGPAAHWSFRHRDASMTVIDAGGRAFSPHPSDYEPRCIPCHSAYDHEQR